MRYIVKFLHVNYNMLYKDNKEYIHVDDGFNYLSITIYCYKMEMGLKAISGVSIN